MIAIGNDHAAYELKQEVIRHFQNQVFNDFGAHSSEPVDYPIYARQVCEAVLSGACATGILLCGTGVGMSIAANRYPGIRAALCRDTVTAVAAREHNDANVLVLGARVTDSALVMEIINTFLNTAFTHEERHVRRLGMLNDSDIRRLS